MKKLGLGTLGSIALVLLIIGGLNIGFEGIFGYNVVSGIFGGAHVLLRTVYVLIGLSALWTIFYLAKGGEK